MTEEEAMHKWCPMVSFQIGHNDAGWQGKGYNNRGQEYEPKSCLCIASDCMMWKWTTSPEYARTERARGDSNLTASGHCGLVNYD